MGVVVGGFVAATRVECLLRVSPDKALIVYHTFVVGKLSIDIGVVVLDLLEVNRGHRGKVGRTRELCAVEGRALLGKWIALVGRLIDERLVQSKHLLKSCKE